MEKLAFELPLGKVSFGQVSTLILKELFTQEKKDSQKYEISLFPIGGIDFSSQPFNEEFNKWVQSKVQYGLENHDRKVPVFRLWHFNNSLSSFSEKQHLFTFYECDEPTKSELNVGKNNNLIFSSKYSCETFKKYGIESTFLPLAWDSYNFKIVQKKFHSDDRIVFNIGGKAEFRKAHIKTIQAWTKKFGNNPKYALQCAIYNPFFGRTAEECNANNNQMIAKIVNGAKPFNEQFYPLMNENSIYNEFLNSADIVIGMSMSEGWDLPCFQSVAMGKHAVLLKAHVYPDWATDEMVTWVNPTGKIPMYDNIFFQKGAAWNQGNGYTFNDDEFIAACETAIRKVEKSRVNEPGFELQKTFSKEKFLDNILKIMK